MSKMKWDQTGERIAEAGVDQGALFPYVGSGYTKGVPWNGLTSVNEAPTGAEANPFYADNQKYLEIMSEEEYAATIGCYTYPDEFKTCIGETELTPGVTVGQQSHRTFGFAYRTRIVNDTLGTDYGFKLHLVYNGLAGVSNRDHTTINDSPELEEISFDVTTTKVEVTGGKPTAHLIIDSTRIPAGSESKLQQLIDTIYGKDADDNGPAIEPTFLLPDQVAAIMKAETVAPKLTALAVSGESFTEGAFAEGTLNYTIATTNSTGILSFTKSPVGATTTVKLNGTVVTDMEMTWEAGLNTILVEVKNDGITVTYKIELTKS